MWCVCDFYDIAYDELMICIRIYIYTHINMTYTCHDTLAWLIMNGCDKLINHLIYEGPCICVIYNVSLLLAWIHIMNTYEYILSIKPCWFRAIIQYNSIFRIYDCNRFIFSMTQVIQCASMRNTPRQNIFWGYDWSASDSGCCSARKYDVDLSCYVSNMGLVESRDRWWWYVPSWNPFEQDAPLTERNSLETKWNPCSHVHFLPIHLGWWHRHLFASRSPVTCRGVSGGKVVRCNKGLAESCHSPDGM